MQNPTKITGEQIVFPRIQIHESKKSLPRQKGYPFYALLQASTVVVKNICSNQFISDEWTISGDAILFPIQI